LLLFSVRRIGRKAIIQKNKFIFPFEKIYMKQILTFAFLYLSFYAQAQKKITLEDIYKNGIFAAKGVAGFRSMANGKFYTQVKDGLLQKVSFKDGKVAEVLLDYNTLMWQNKKIEVEEYEFNAEENKVLLFEGAEPIYRRSILYNTYVVDLQTKQIQRITEGKIMHASFQPISNKIAYVKGNNLYMYNMNTKTETAITTDGKWNHIINGNCDWVYEEEFGFTKAFSWSANGKYIAYYKFDESQVKEFNFAQYDGLYPKDIRYKYPKAGEDNSKVSIYLFDVTTEKSTKVDIGNEVDIYVPRIKWNTVDGKLYIYKLNRLQNKLTVFNYTPGEAQSELVYNEDNDKYIDINDDIVFLEKQNAFIYRSEKTGFQHLWLFDIATSKDVQITKGDWEVTALQTVNEKTKTIYFTSTEKSAMERNLYSISFDGKTKTCLTPEAGTHNVQCSNGGEYFMDIFSSMNVPPVYNIKDAKGKTLRVLEDNAALKNKMKDYAPIAQTLVKVPVEDGTSLNAWILQPMDKMPNEKHPLLMFQYSGPGSQQVTNSYIARDYWWYQYLVQQGYAIACVDGRGTGYRGQDFKKCTYKQLGNLESNDQIAAAKYFGKQSNINASRIGIWGWSYGGYMSSICICKGADVFKSAIAVAPVTNWRYYDNIYTERFMQKPQDNARGYDDNSPVNMVSKLKGNYLLIHGSADDNVHYQNSMEMVNALIKADKEYDFEVYPNKAHGISGGNTRFHLYKRMTAFLLEKL
jgi:dipeptidyl-peptidase 4